MVWLLSVVVRHGCIVTKRCKIGFRLLLITIGNRIYAFSDKMKIIDLGWLWRLEYHWQPVRLAIL